MIQPTPWADDPYVPNFTEELLATAFSNAKVLADMPDPSSFSFEVRSTTGFWRDVSAQEAIAAYGRGCEIRVVTNWLQPVPEDRPCEAVDDRYGRCRRLIRGRNRQHPGLHRNNGAVWS